MNREEIGCGVLLAFACRITFYKQKKFADATIWYLEKFKIPKERLNPSDPWKEYHLEKCYIRKIEKLLQEYMKYEIGIERWQ